MTDESKSLHVLKTQKKIHQDEIADLSAKLNEQTNFVNIAYMKGLKAGLSAAIQSLDRVETTLKEDNDAGDRS